MVKQYYNNIYKGREKHKLKINNNIFDFTVEIDRALEALAIHKAAGPDLISAECLKVKDKRNEMKSRLFAHFTDHLHNWRVPDYYMKARLVLFSKEDNENQEINKTRPISILPSITKAFEYSIAHNFEKKVQQPYFDPAQRGFSKGKSTLHNINDLLTKMKEEIFIRKNGQKHSATIIFFDFEKAYDSVPRKTLIQKLLTYWIAWNIVAVIVDMLEKFNLYYNSEEITTERGLVQGSILSPMLFNLFINDLLIALRIQGIYTLVYADDIAWVWRSLEETHKEIQIMKSWCTENSMKINESKSGILRILQRKVKWKGIKNELNIPEVDSYRYLGVQITQTASIKEHAHVLRKIERYMKRRLCILRPTLINTRNRLP